MCHLIDSFAGDESCGGFARYAPLHALLLCVNHLIDIMNARREKDCWPIDSPDSPLLSDLESTLALFTEWKVEAGADTEEFIPNTLYQDLCWLCLGTIGMASFYLSRDKIYVMAQHRSGSDCVEHHFGNADQRNSNGTVLNMTEASARSTGVRCNSFNVCSKANTAGSQILAAELTLPLLKAVPKKSM